MGHMTFFAGFVVGTLQNTTMTDAERLEAIAEKAIELDIAPDIQMTPSDRGERDPWLGIAVCGICGNTYSTCDCARSGRR